MLGLLKRLFTDKPITRKISSEVANSEVEKVDSSTGEQFSLSSEEALKASGKQGMVDGKPTYAYAESHKHDLETMLRCCHAEEEVYWSSDDEKLSPSPFYFERAAILLRKEKDYEGELEICQRWVAMMDDLAAWIKKTSANVANVDAGPRSQAIRQRLVKAKELLEKHKKP